VACGGARAGGRCAEAFGSVAPFRRLRDGDVLWIKIILGIIQLSASFLLLAAQAYGRFVGIIAASLGATGALLNLGGAHPWWSLGIFGICLVCIHGLTRRAEEI
jgi:uncharacterized membrane protein